VIGSRRWARPKGHAWHEQPYMRLAMPSMQWGPRVTNAHLLGSAVLDRKPVWLISFYDPDFGGFFEIWVDKQSLHTLELTLTAGAHFMQHRYSDFNAPLAIRAPR